MVLLHIITHDQKIATEICDYLVDRKLILNAVVMEQVHVRKLDSSNKLVSEPRILIMGKTKALLFDKIDRELREIYANQMPVLYSIPIVSMDWEQARELADETVKV